ncbi:ankyrin repeat domain-containing protein 50 [Elysia marginata]|uniref:Ankyrin repeat domain-containing protein 50 n=1 Tax=Elysia marginata TaxID=1093978 RepID=A0AAV4FFV6_9GAST|nr:ankyrin repeat domain-containing protein 50 [Elysia marginata]
MPDLSVSRQDVMAGPMVKYPSQSSGLDSTSASSSKINSNNHKNTNNSLFQHDKQKMTMANSFFQAVIKGSVNKVKHQLSRGHSINSKNDYGMSPLVAALHIEDEAKRSRMFCLLLEKGCSYKTRDTSHDRPVLHWACVLGQVPEVKTLLEETAGDIKLSEKDGEGYTALHHAVKIGNLPIVQNLVDYHVKFGVPVDLPDKMGLTPYIHARRLGYRDVAGILREQGLASLGHGDNLFRSPREWSQIGKFERKKAIELSINDQVNAAKVMGKLNLARLVSNSPRMAVPGIVVPSMVPDMKPKPPAPGMGRKSHHISVSLPSLADAINEEETPRPSSAEKDNHKGSEHGSSTTVGNHRPGPPRVAFESDSNKSSVYSYSSTTNRGSVTQRSGVVMAANSLPHKPVLGRINPGTYGSMENSAINGGILDYQGNMRGLNNPLRSLPNDPTASYGSPQRVNFGAPVRANSNLAALSLLEQSSFQRGRLANSFHQSHFDTSKASEYGHMMGNLSSFMDVLAQQQTKSFRKSVEVKKPVTPPKPKKKKNKVSTLAIIFGKERGGKRRGARSPKSAKNSRNKGDKDGKSKTKASNSRDAKENSKNRNSEQKLGKGNKLPVPTIRIN